jgi:hypothetical protein
MVIKDTITVRDSTLSRFIIIEDFAEFPKQETPLPADSLWGKSTLSITTPAKGSVPAAREGGDYFISGLILGFFILLVIFSRELLNTVPTIVKTILSHKNHIRAENILSFSSQRNTSAILSALFFPIFITISLGDYLGMIAGIPSYFVVLGITAFMVGYWVFKTIVLRFLGWLTKIKQPFNYIGKIGYNHLIISLISSIPAVIFHIFWPDIEEIYLIKLLIYSIISIYLLYQIRIYQTIISYRFSHFFYILYLCGVEILPLALLTNFLLSYQ